MDYGSWSADRRCWWRKWCIKTVYSFANLTDGTTFSDSDLNNTFNAYTVKEIWKMAKEGGGIKNIAQSGSGNAITDMTLSSDGKTITAVFGETFARQQDLGTLNNTVTQLSNKLNNFLEGLTGNDTLTELLALKADKTITISAGTGLTGGGNLSANRTLSLATTGAKAGTYTKVTVTPTGVLQSVIILPLWQDMVLRTHILKPRLTGNM